jgi:hypothetical protein
LAQDDDKQRTTRERIERLRERLREAKTWEQLRNVMKGILDLLADEL